MRTKIFIYTLFIGLISFSSFASEMQQKEKPKQITNKVIDNTGAALSGVDVIVNEGAIQTTTNAEGTFTVKVKNDAIFLFEFSGYKSQVLTAKEVLALKNGITLEQTFIDRVNEEVNLPYNSIMKRYRTTGNIAVIDAENALETDVRMSIGSAITNKVPGMSGSTNVHGLGAGVIVVDGVVSEASDVVLTEIEQITILKDPISRMIYGADGDKGVVMIKTKNGTPYKKELNFRASYSINDAISYPKYLNSANYMKTYNQAYLNDGGDPLAMPYSPEIIGATEAGTDPVRYPDVDYYSSDFVKSMTNSKNVYGEALGGNEKVQYLLNFMWDNSQGWLEQGANMRNDVLRTRGKVSAEVFDWLKVRAEITARFDVDRGANIGEGNNDYWGKSTSYLPNAYPLLIPKDRIANFDELTGEQLIDGQYLLGGTSIYTGNLIGDMSRTGDVTKINRWLNFNNGLDFDLKGITEGLSATAQMNFQFFNSYYEKIDNTYAVYEPLKDESGQIIVDENNQMTVKKIGEDKITTSQSVNQNDMDFYRNLNAYLSLNYNRTFDNHDISAMLVAYGKRLVRNNVSQDEKRVAFGGNLNYMYNNKYVVELGGLVQGSNKLNPNDRFGFAPSVGAGWVASNEDFLGNNSFIDYLKLRASYGVIQNDNFNTNLGDYNGYFLYEPIYKVGRSYWYGNGGYTNNEMLISNVGNIYSWQQRKEFSLGFDSYLFNKRTWLEATYFNSKVEDELVKLENVSATMGDVDVISNYNSYRYSGFEMGIEHKESLGIVNLTVGLNYMNLNSEVINNEAVVEVEHLNREGMRRDAVIGYTADGFYQPADFNEDGSLKEGLPVPSFGAVKPGDIKYVDFYEDGVINANDQHNIGNSVNNNIFSLNLDVRINNWQLFAQANAAMGGTGFINGSNYYWFKGNEAKYSEKALLAYTPDASTGENTNPDAVYPRLTLGKGSNNYRRSTFWAYDKDYFKIGYVQAAYNFNLKRKSFLSNTKLYLSATNILTVAKDETMKEMMDLNIGNSPASRTYTLGLIANF